MFSFVFSFCPTCCTKYLCFEASQYYSLLQGFREFRSFLNFEKFSTVKFSEKFQENYIKNFHNGRDPKSPGASQGGPPVAQAASWRGPAPGRAHRAPGAHRSRLQVSLLPLSLFLSENMSSAPVLAFLLFLEAIFDLSLQPIIRAEILNKYSLVCNSSTPPIRFFVGGFICEYLVVLGAVEMSLHACVESYFSSFDASLCLGQVS